MRVIAFDTETHLVVPGLLVPPLVCLTWHEAGQDRAGIIHANDGAVDVFRGWLEDPNIILAGHNVAYDLAVLAEAGGEDTLRLVFAALDAGRIRDTQLREYLIAILLGQRQNQPDGHFSLAALAARYLGMTLEKGQDTWRMRYAELSNVPVDQWPAEARDYALTDATTTLRVLIAQDQVLDLYGYKDLGGEHCAVTEQDQCRAAFALHLASAWGVHTDPAELGALTRKLTDTMRELEPELLSSGILKRKRDGGLSRSMECIRALIVAGHEAAGLPVPQTDGGAVSTDADAVAAAAPFCTALEHLADYARAQKLLGTFVEAAGAGVETPIQSRFSPIMVTNRTSSQRPNIQNLPRPDKKRGLNFRRVFIPRPGHVFSSCDYGTLELRTLAQVCLDWGIPSRMADAFRAGLDPHVLFAKAIAAEGGVIWDSASKDARKQYRNLAKAGNFGFPGGLGAERFVAYAAGGYGVKLTVAQAKILKRQWQEQWPEMREYHARIGAMERGGFITLTIPRCGMTRGNARYTEACNCPFQGLAAHGAKRALYAVVRAMALAEPDDPLYGSHVVNFIHDEILSEHPQDRADAAAPEVARIMKETMEAVTPDVPHVVEPALMERWEKDAEPTYDDNGRLIPWAP